VAGKIKQIINKIIAERSKGNETLKATTRTKLILKGINVNNFNEKSEDDPVIITKLQEIAKEMSVQL
jgi:hypothetical protein